MNAARTPTTDEQLAAIRTRFERTTHPDWRDDTDTGQLLAEIDRLHTELTTARTASMREAAAMFRHYCPNHGNADTRFITCYCDAAAVLDHAAAAMPAPTT